MPDPVTSQSFAPTNKVVAATGGSAFGAAISTILIYLLTLLDIKLPAEVTAAVTTIVTAVFTGGIAYMVPPGANEAVSMINGKVRTAVVTPPV